MNTSQLTPGQAAILAGITAEDPAPETSTQPREANDTVKQLSDDELATLIGLLLEEQHERAVEMADPEALTTEGYDQLFNSKGEALAPELVDGILVCAGSLINKSATSHVCSFVHVDEHWCWDHPDAVHDDVRKVPAQGREHQRSITLIPVTEGAKIDFVTSKYSAREGHKAQRSVSYIVTEGTLEVTNTRTAPSPSAGRH